MARRSEARLPTTSMSRRISSEGGDPSADVTWNTPIELPAMLTGIQAAEQPRPRRFGQASSAVLVGNTMVCPWDAAGQSSGDTTPHPLPSRGARVDQNLAKVRPARVGQEQFGVDVGRGIDQGFTHQVEDRCLRLGHLERPLQSGLELVAAGHGEPATSAFLRSSRSTRRARSANSVVKPTANRVPMRMLSSRSTLAASAAAWAWWAFASRRVVKVACEVASALSRLAFAVRSAVTIAAFCLRGRRGVDVDGQLRPYGGIGGHGGGESRCEARGLRAPDRPPDVRRRHRRWRPMPRPRWPGTWGWPGRRQMPARPGPGNGPRRTAGSCTGGWRSRYWLFSAAVSLMARVMFTTPSVPPMTAMAISTVPSAIRARCGEYQLPLCILFLFRPSTHPSISAHVADCLESRFNDSGPRSPFDVALGVPMVGGTHRGAGSATQFPYGASQPVPFRQGTGAPGPRVPGASRRWSDVPPAVPEALDRPVG